MKRKSLFVGITILSGLFLTACSNGEHTKSTSSSHVTRSSSSIKKKEKSIYSRQDSSSKKATSSKSVTDSETTTSSSSQKADDSEENKTMSFDEAAALIEKGGFTDFNYNSAASLHDGSHPTSDGGYVMITYPGAKGKDTFTITKTGDGKYHISAEYGTLDGGTYSPLTDQSLYGPSAADVTK